MTLGEHSDTGYSPFATKFVQVNMQYGCICRFGGIPQGKIDEFYIVWRRDPPQKSISRCSPAKTWPSRRTR